MVRGFNPLPPQTPNQCHPPTHLGTGQMDTEVLSYAKKTSDRNASVEWLKLVQVIRTLCSVHVAAVEKPLLCNQVIAYCIAIMERLELTRRRWGWILNMQPAKYTQRSTTRESYILQRFYPNCIQWAHFHCWLKLTDLIVCVMQRNGIFFALSSFVYTHVTNTFINAIANALHFTNTFTVSNAWTQGTKSRFKMSANDR